MHRNAIDPGAIPCQRGMHARIPGFPREIARGGWGGGRTDGRKESTHNRSTLRQAHVGDPSPNDAIVIIIRSGMCRHHHPTQSLATRTGIAAAHSLTRDHLPAINQAAREDQVARDGTRQPGSFRAPQRTDTEDQAGRRGGGGVGGELRRTHLPCPLQPEHDRGDLPQAVRTAPHYHQVEVTAGQRQPCSRYRGACIDVGGSASAGKAGTCSARIRLTSNGRPSREALRVG